MGTPGVPLISICDQPSGNQVNPADPLSILNPLFTPDNGNLPGISILIYLGNTPFEFNSYYVGKSLNIQENRGFERGSAKLVLADSDPVHFNLPFAPLIDMRIEIWNRSQNDLLFTGRIASVEPTFLWRRCNGTEALNYELTCTDLKVDFERILVAERYQNVTTGFIARDVVRRFTFFDYTAIDPLIGGTVTDMRFNNDYVATVLQRILDLEPTWTFWFDYATLQVHIGEAGSVTNTVLNVDETNVYDYFEPQEITLVPDNWIIRNRVYFFYNAKYAEGTVSITEGDVIVSGQGTRFLSFVREGATIQFNNEPADYTVSQVLSDTELRISSPYQAFIPNLGVLPVILTEVPYITIGTETAIVVEDSANIAYMAQINGETGKHNGGVYEYKVPNDGTPYTEDEAYSIAQSHLMTYISPFIAGGGKSDNVRIPLRNLHAGQAIFFNLPNSRKVIATVVIQQLTKTDTGALLPRIDTDPGENRIDALLSYDFDFKDRIYDQRNQLKRLQIDIRRSSFDDTIIQDVLSIGETIQIGSCVHLYDTPIAVTEEIDVADEVTLHQPPTPGPYYTSPTGRLAGYTIGYSQWGFTS